MKRQINNEEGQALPLAIIALAVGSLLVGGFLSFMSTNIIASGIFSRSLTAQYAADAGVEDAIWNLMYGDLAETALTNPGDSVSYSLTEAVNGFTSEVGVTRDRVNVASDDFESGGWSGGSGWLNNWAHAGDASIVTTSSPHNGKYHLRLRSYNGYVKRAINLSSSPANGLQFWAKANSFEGSESARCLVSFNGNDWTEVKKWVDGNDDNLYHLYEIDLSSYAPFSQLWIAFEAKMSDTGDYLYIDDLMVVRMFPGASFRLPNDDFESGNWSGGSNWLYNWYYTGSSTITTSGNPHGGSYHLRMRSSGSYVNRAADLSGQSGLHLQFWAKVNSFESTDKMYCLVSPDKIQWNTVKTWTSTDSDNTYHFVDIDLSPYTMSSEFWIAFNSGMSGNDDYFYVDDLRIVGATAFEIVSRADSGTIRATAGIQDSELTIHSWQIE